MRRVILKGLMARKLRLVLTAVSISLGVAFVTGTLVLSDTMTATFEQLYDSATEGVDVSVRGETAFSDTSTLGEHRPFDEAMADDIAEVDGVEAAAGSVSGFGLILDKQGEPIQPGGAPTYARSYPADDRLSGGVTLREGDEPSGSDEVVLDAATARDNGFEPGDPVTVMLADGPHQFTMVGIAGFGDADNLAGATMAFFDLGTAQQLLGKAGTYDVVEVHAADGVSAEELRDRIEEMLPSGLEAVTAEELVNEYTQAVAEALGFFTSALLGFAAVSLLVGSLIIWNTFSILVAQRTRELALMRAVGASRRQVMGSVVIEALVIGAIAAALGLLLGLAVAAGLQALLAAVGLEVPTTTPQLGLRTVLAAFLVGVGVTVVAALLPARQATKVAPIAALRAVDAPVKPMGLTRVIIGVALTLLGAAALVWAMIVEAQLLTAAVGMVLALAGVLTIAPALASLVTRAVGAVAARMGGVTAQLARRNALRNPKRTANTAVALMIGLALVSAVTVVADSMKASVTEVLETSSRSEFMIKAAAMTAPGVPTQLAAELREVDGVEAISQLRVSTVQVDGATTMAGAVNPDAIEKTADLQVSGGEIADLDDRSVFVSDDAAEEKGWAIGDTIEITYPQTGAQEFEIVGTFANTALIGSHYLVTLAADEANTGNLIDAAVLIALEDGVDPEDAQPRLEAVTDRYPNAALNDAEGFTESQMQTVDQMLAVVTMMLLLAVVIALLGIVNTLALSVFERTRELGLLRAVGMTRSQVRALVRWEAVFVALLGGLLGALLGLAAGAALARGMAEEGLDVVVIPGGTLAIYVVLAIAAGVLAAVSPARRASKVDVLRAVAAQ